ncbi:benzoate-CoA ligase family protein [Rhodovulum sp. PH10]|uniref:benzoate-CoA ligase family protein n=1 Tax=Rhodovulum sp. PH10 TaxID=1187851 RepID=UPI0012FB42E7|nr:benzoate-CoA ligase family protein [Rhodovulum sp. PH10]
MKEDVTTLRLPGLSVDTSRSPAEFSFGPGFNAASAFIDRHLAEGRGDKVFIRPVSGRTVTFAALVAGVNRCGNVLRTLGLVAGERMLMVVKDCPEFYFLLWGAIKAGIVPVPLNTLLRTGDYRYMIGDSGCAAMVWSAEFSAEVLPAVQAARPGLRVALPVEDGKETITGSPLPVGEREQAAALAEIVSPSGGSNTLASLMAGASDELDVVPASAETPCFWLYSSGSTGRPKAVVHRHRDPAVSSQWYGREVLGIGEDDVTFSASKLFFAYGFNNSGMVPLWTGSSVVLLDGKPTPQNTFDVIEKFRPTLYYGIPTLYAAQLQAMESTTPNLSSLRVCVSAGEPLPPDIFLRWKARTGHKILDGIGSTEAMHIFITNRPEDARPGVSGRPVPGFTVRIVDELGAELPPGEPGRLQVKGLSTALCYWNNPEKTAATMQGDWLDTGDTYSRDAEGFFRYCGRSNDMLKVGGIWCSPIEIESCLASHPDVLEAAVIGVPDGDGLVKPEAWIVPCDGVRPSESFGDALMRHCKSTLAPYKFPRKIHFLDELPKTATGKIQRYRLRRLFEETT